MEHFWEGSIFTAMALTTASDIFGQHNKKGGVTSEVRKEQVRFCVYPEEGPFFFFFKFFFFLVFLFFYRHKKLKRMLQKF